MFRGAAKSKLDSKGRMMVPNKYRQALGNSGEEIILTGHPAGCLMLFRIDAFLELESKILKLPDSSERALYNKQVVVGYADQMKLDSYGRILINSELRDHAGLAREVLLTGMNVHVRLWDEAYWRNFCQRMKGQDSPEPPPGWDDFSYL